MLLPKNEYWCCPHSVVILLLSPENDGSALDPHKTYTLPLSLDRCYKSEDSPLLCCFWLIPWGLLSLAAERSFKAFHRWTNLSQSLQGPLSPSLSIMKSMPFLNPKILENKPHPLVTQTHCPLLTNICHVVDLDLHPDHPEPNHVLTMHSLA